ncbi:MAG: DUF5685 family protein [Acutalibacteraceae bacterium]
MFGYVKAYKPELKIAEYDTYKAVYCSLCRQLGKDYGIFAKFILSYDFVFLAMLKLGLQDECCGYTKMRCPFNPLKKCMRLEKKSDALEFSAACLIIMFYYKLLDDMKDNGIKGKLRSGILFPFFNHYRKKARKKFADIDDKLSELIRAQTNIENSESCSVDMAAEPTAKMLEYIFSYGCSQDVQKRVLSRVGYLSGKWVYLIDALDDLKEDLKKSSYNPFIKRYELKNGDDLGEAVKNSVSLINNCNVELANTFELLDFKRYKTILSNIIYLGLPDQLKKVTDKENEK